jgi:DNA-binding MarR family transcriptional regulator
MALIAANPGFSQNELSQDVGLDKSVTVTIVDELEKRGWAKRERSKSDRRRHALFVTSTGEAKLDELFGILAQTENAALHQLSSAELHLLNELLDRLYSAFTREG